MLQPYVFLKIEVNMNKLLTPKLRFDVSCSSSIKGENDRIFTTNAIRSSLDDFTNFNSREEEAKFSI